jgi:hypothetical protein
MYPGKELTTTNNRKKSKKIKSSHLNDLLNNGNHFPIGIILLKENPTVENARRILTFTNPASAPLITDDMKSLIMDHMVDAYIYLKIYFYNSCQFFKIILFFKTNKETFKIGTEWDTKDSEDLSVNRCPVDNNVQYFVFNEFKLGKLTPHQDNDCSGPHYLLDENLVHILDYKQLNLPCSSRSDVSIPDVCASSTMIQERRSILSESVALDR